LHVRTIAALLIWIVVALLLLNTYFKSGWILLVVVATIIIAILVYFGPQLKKRYGSSKRVLNPACVVTSTLIHRIVR